MNRISISQAWAYATSFFSDQHQNHAILLIGVGIVGPLLLNLILGGGVASMTTVDQAGGVAALGAVAILVGLLAYILQSGSYYASWRMGLAPGQESIGSALSYGLVAALPVLLVGLALLLVVGIIGGVMFGASLLPLIMGGEQAGAALAAGSFGMLFLALPVFLVLMLWLAARFCCMSPIMAANRSYNPLTALAESWRMTAASQWKLMAYFVLIGVVVVIIMLIVGMIVGVSALAGGGMPGTNPGIVAMLLGTIVTIPLAYMSVAIPAGIYRALGGGHSSDIFA